MTSTVVPQPDTSLAPCRANFYNFWRVVSYRRHNHPCEILSRLVKGLGGYVSPKSLVSHWLWSLLLQQCYTLTCYTVIMHCNVIEKPHIGTTCASIARLVSDSLAFLFFLSISWCVGLRYKGACHESSQLTFHVTSHAIITGWSSSLSLLMCGSKHFWQRFMLWFPTRTGLSRSKRHVVK